jgi:hypothetical protein
MRIFKTRLFSRWAKDEGMTDEALREALDEVAAGLVDANLGGHVYKKRIGLNGRGKRGGVRTLIAFRIEDKAFFLYGFAKNERENISSKELKALRLLAGAVPGIQRCGPEKSGESRRIDRGDKR